MHSILYLRSWHIFLTTQDIGLSWVQWRTYLSCKCWQNSWMMVSFPVAVEPMMLGRGALLFLARCKVKTAEASFWRGRGTGDKVGVVDIERKIGIVSSSSNGRLRSLFLRVSEIKNA